MKAAPAPGGPAPDPRPAGGPAPERLPPRALEARVLDGMAQGRPLTGPTHVHIDVTNSCNAACVTCWDHSPLLAEPRPAAWKRRRLPLPRFTALVDQLVAFGSVRAVVLSGMGEPLTHPDVYPMLERLKAEGFRVTLMTNLVAADLDQLVPLGLDQVLVGVQGASPETHAAFHPGWSEEHFHRLCAGLRRLVRAGTKVRHVHVIERGNAHEIVEMVRFGKLFGADRVNLKLASLAAGTEATAITEAQRAELRERLIPAAEALAARLGVPTNLALFRRQVEAGGLATAPLPDTGLDCWMGHVYTRVTVDEDVLYCCNTNVHVGNLGEGTLAEWWWGPRWQALREQLARREWLPGCERCGKLEQNLAWSERLAAWRRARGAA